MIRFQRPTFPPAHEIERYFALSRRERWFSNGGPCLRLLTERLQQISGCECVLVASGTAGLMVSIAALRRRHSGPLALVPSFTFAATLQSLIWNGFEPVFLDVDPDHFHVPVEELTAALEQRPGHIGLVLMGSSFGTPPPPEVRRGWERACAEVEVPLLVDSAAGFGGIADDGVPIAAQGDVEVVSFHITKPFGIGEGGAAFTQDAGLADEMRHLANFDFDSNRQVQSMQGTNAKLDELHAAVGLAVLDTFPEVLNRRRTYAQDLLSRIGDGLDPQEGHQRGTYQFLPLKVVSREARDHLLRRAEGAVELRTYYEPLHLMEPFAEVTRASALAVTEELSHRMLSLPMANDLTEYEIDRIAQTCTLGSSIDVR